YLVEDNENQTAHLNLPGGYWWYWYGSEFEAHAYYLKLLVATNPKDPVAPMLVKYLVNNRKHATYWNSTRDTALVVEALADYIQATGEAKPDMTVEVWIDGQKRQDVKITGDNLFAFDNSFVLAGDSLEAGRHTVELRKSGTGPLYWNGYLTNFTLEDDIRAAGLELKVQRRFYKLTPTDKSIEVAGGRGQVVDEQVEKFIRTEIPNLGAVESGDLIEIELEIESKNDYEYVMFEDLKAAGTESVALQSGYNSNDLGAYMELRDNRVTFFCSQLARGKHSVSYRLRAEIPGRFSALPARASAMYAPELKGNSNELKLRIEDRPSP
ncbi:MAG: alpha-2-macroglobulin, partial [Pirellulales bacterium]